MINKETYVQATTSSTNLTIPSELANWNEEELYELHAAVKLRGSSMVKDIQKKIRTKSEEEIGAAIAYFKSRAKIHPDCDIKKVKVKKIKTKPIKPLAAWARKLTDSLSFEELQTEMSLAFRLIADFEDIPNPLLTEQIDFGLIYRQIADAMEGRSNSLIKNRLIDEVIKSCILEAALCSRSVINSSTFTLLKKHLGSPGTEKEVNMFPQPTNDNALAILRQLCIQNNYNPLSVEEKYWSLVPDIKDLQGGSTP